MLTKTSSNSLTSRGESQCFSNCHFSYVQIMLAYVSRCPLWYELLHLVPVVCHSSRYLPDIERSMKLKHVLHHSKNKKKKKKKRRLLLTSNSGSSFPAKARSNVVFPELGGPKSRVILQTRGRNHLSCSFNQEKRKVGIKFLHYSCSPSWFDDSTNIMKNWQRFLPTWKNTKTAQEPLNMIKKIQFFKPILMSMPLYLNELDHL